MAFLGIFCLAELMSALKLLKRHDLLPLKFAGNYWCSHFEFSCSQRSIFLAWREKMFGWSTANANRQSNLGIVFIFHQWISWVLTVKRSLFFRDNGREDFWGTLEWRNPFQPRVLQMRAQTVNGHFCKKVPPGRSCSLSLQLAAPVKWDQPINASSFQNFISHGIYCAAKLFLGTSISHIELFCFSPLMGTSHP